MKICEQCFEDEVINELIKKNGKIGNCSFCKASHKKTIAIENEELKDYFGALLDLYITFENESDDSSSEGELLKTILKNDWNIFSEKIDPASIEKILRKILPEREKLYSKKVKILIKKDYDELSIFKNSQWKKFVKEIKEENRFHTDIFDTDNFGYFLSRLSVNLKRGEILYRGRISTSEGYKKEEMGTPPLGKSSDGRINPKGIGCLYLADDKDTILLEMRVLKNDFITIGKFKLKNDITIVDLTKLTKLSPFFDLDNLLKHGINQKYLKEIAEEISRPQNRENNSLDYLPSQYISELIKKLGFAGIKYESTVKDSGVNYAIFDEKNFICKEVKVYKIKEMTCTTEKIK